MEVFVIQGGLEGELRAPENKKHVSVAHNAQSVGAEVFWEEEVQAMAVLED